MYLYNITFIMAHTEQERFLSWMRESALPVLFNSESSAKNPRLQTVVEAGGEKPGPDHGLSIALQAEFDSEVKAQEWHDTLLPRALQDFHAKFAPHAAFFITLLETLPL